MSGWLDEYNYAAIQPNLAPNRTRLPNADYGRIGALKLVESVFKGPSESYTSGGNGAYGSLGQYHFYLLGKNYKIKANDMKRARLTAKPTYASFNTPPINLDLEKDGPIYHKQVLSDMAVIADTYGFPVQLVISAFLVLVQENFDGVAAGNYPAGINGEYAQAGWTRAKYTPESLEALWGIRSFDLPKTLTNRVGRGGTISAWTAANNEYGGKIKRGKRSKRRRRY